MTGVSCRGSGIKMGREIVERGEGGARLHLRPARRKQDRGER